MTNVTVVGSLNIDVCIEELLDITLRDWIDMNATLCDVEIDEVFENS